MNIRIDQATLNVTWAGNNGDLPDAVSYDSSDADLKQVASEAIRTGYIPGVDADPRVVDFRTALQVVNGAHPIPNKVAVA